MSDIFCKGILTFHTLLIHNGKFHPVTKRTAMPGKQYAAMGAKHMTAIDNHPTFIPQVQPGCQPIREQQDIACRKNRCIPSRLLA
jgi:hypothetical protein